jgi:hypothetical protein
MVCQLCLPLETVNEVNSMIWDPILGYRVSIGDSLTHLILILFSPTSVLAPACTYKYEIIPLHNTLNTILSIMYVYYSCFCLISFFLFNLSKSCLFTSHVYFQFRIKDHPVFKLTHMTHTSSSYA